MSKEFYISKYSSESFGFIGISSKCLNKLRGASLRRVGILTGMQRRRVPWDKRVLGEDFLDMSSQQKTPRQSRDISEGLQYISHLILGGLGVLPEEQLCLGCLPGAAVSCPGSAGEVKKSRKKKSCAGSLFRIMGLGADNQASIRASPLSKCTSSSPPPPPN